MNDAREYWVRNIRYVTALLLVWFAVSYGCGILFKQELDTVRLPGSGFGLGFWFAQQGSIYVFVVLIFVYVRLMNRLDREFGVDERDGEDTADGPSGAGPDDAGPRDDAGGAR